MEGAQKVHGRPRWLSIGFALTGWVVPVSALGAERPGLYLEPIPGLTTVRHIAPEAVTVPTGTLLQLTQQLPNRSEQDLFETPFPDPGPTAAVPRDVIQWIGAEETDRSPDVSRAELRVEHSGEYRIDVSVDDTDGTTITRSVRVLAVDVAADRVGVRRAIPFVNERPLSETSTNEETMQAYFGESIAPLVSVAAAREGALRGGKTLVARYRTSINRTIQFDLRTDPPGFESLVEVRVPGEQPYLAQSNPRSFGTVGVHRVSVGPPRLARELEVETYEVVITSHRNGVDRIPEGVPVTFTAVTNPPGHEDEIRWVSSTKFGTAQPVTGQGSTFTVVFANTWGRPYDDPFAPMQWLGVKAAQSGVGNDDSVTKRPCCTGASTCNVVPLEVCDALGGFWAMDHDVCGGSVCSTPPGNRCKYLLLTGTATNCTTCPCTGGDIWCSLSGCTTNADCPPFSVTLACRQGGGAGTCKEDWGQGVCVSSCTPTCR